MRKMIRMLAMFGALLASMPARAAWFEATTTHFVVDADAPEARVKDFASRLERFDAALRLLYNVADDPSRKSNRVRVFATDRSTIVDLCHGCPSQVAGFYNPHAGGSVIFTGSLESGQNRYVLNSQTILLHEYSHHFMYSNYPIAYPLWYSEGFAEFNSNVDFREDGSIDFGLPANYRGEAMGWYKNSGTGITLETVLDPGKTSQLSNETLEQIYDYGWLLTHYLMLDDKHRQQLGVYLAETNKGVASVAAAEHAFGDLRALGAALERYRTGRLLPPLRVPPGTAPVSVTVTALSPGAVSMMPVHMRSSAGVTKATAKGVARDAEIRVRNFPDDPRVQDELAEAEYDAENDDAADAAADRALKVDPRDTTALLYKGRVAIRRAQHAKTSDAAAWQAARAWYIKANHADPDAALPLLLYFASYPLAKQAPSGLGRPGADACRSARTGGCRRALDARTPHARYRRPRLRALPPAADRLRSGGSRRQPAVPPDGRSHRCREDRRGAHEDGRQRGR